ncbi:MAG: OB-fold nucleic acid binding domain-containing protein, partial [Bacteroidia bacterium]
MEANIHLSEPERIRRQKLSDLLAMGINPFPAEEFPVNFLSTDIKSNYPDNKEDEKWKSVCVAGRIMSVRDMGKAAFVVIQDDAGRSQIYVRRDDICPNEDKTLYDIVFKKLLDIGDIIGIKGYVFTTKTGETSIHAQELQILSKALRPLPIVKEKEGETFDAVTDPEFRYRQRYADLIVNPHVKDTFMKRSLMIKTI